MPAKDLTISEQDRFITEAFTREEPRLRNFVRRQVLSTSDTEDVLQDVFYELIQAYRLMKPAEQMTAWLFRVAKNRVTDLFRRRKNTSLSDPVGDDESEGTLEDLLPSADAGPDAAYARTLMLDALDEALAELPNEQREAFLAHEIEGLSFRDMAEATGVSQNTLLARKHYAVQHLRKRLQHFRKLGTQPTQ